MHRVEATGEPRLEILGSNAEAHTAGGRRERSHRSVAPHRRVPLRREWNSVRGCWGGEIASAVPRKVSS